MTLPAIIIMVIGIIAAIVGVNKQKQGASWGQALAIVGAIIAIGAAVWNFVGTLNGDQKGIQKNQRAQQLRGLLDEGETGLLVAYGGLSAPAKKFVCRHGDLASLDGWSLADLALEHRDALAARWPRLYLQDVSAGADAEGASASRSPFQT